MTFFDDLKSKAVDLAQTGAAKGKQVTELAKLNLNNASEEDAMKKAYAEIGKLYYEMNGTNPAPEFIVACEKVTTAKINMEENNSRIAELKRSDVVVNDGPYAPAAEEETAAPENGTPEE